MLTSKMIVINFILDQLIKSFDFSAEFAKASKKKVKFDKITVGSYQDIFLTSTVRTSYGLILSIVIRCNISHQTGKSK